MESTRTSYTIEDKISVAKHYIEYGSYHKTAELFNVDRKSVKLWVEQIEILRAQSDKRGRRVIQYTRKARENFEEDLY